MFDSRIIANEVLKRAWAEGLELTQIDIQKTTYFMHGHHLIDHGVALVDTEFEAWDHGPVQRSLYNAFKKFGDQPISEFALKFDPIKQVHYELPALSNNAAIATIDTHLEKYLELPSFTMVDITHENGTPWSRTVEAARTSVNIGMRIKNELIVSYFEGLKHA